MSLFINNIEYNITTAMTFCLLILEGEIVIQTIRRDQFAYHGYGKIEVFCQGHGGDNTTTVHWRRKDLNGNVAVLNSTKFESLSGIWKADLLYRPEIRNVTHSYQCVVNNKCNQTKISRELPIVYTSIESTTYMYNNYLLDYKCYLRANRASAVPRVSPG